MKSVYFLGLASMVAVALVACGDDGDGDPQGSGGSSASGGRTGSGGNGPGGVDGQGGDESVGGSPAWFGVCSQPQAHLGYVDCEEGYRHREERVACENVERDERIASDECGIEGNCCAFDSDCGEDAACWIGGPVGNENYGQCKLRCDSDSDCDSNEICECGDGAGRCVESNCQSDSDCAGGALCVRSVRDEGCGQVTAYSCQQESDECVMDVDCDLLGTKPETCATDGTHRTCLNQFQSCDS